MEDKNRPTSLIRNFAIIAHIDHGKSTLADRLLEITGTIKKSNSNEQVLDSNPIEKERGVTIKLAPVRMHYLYNNREYILNLIDTPGHVDFSYEVSRSLAACEGAILLVDASQGIQAQTLSNYQKAVNENLTIIPVLNKIDMSGAMIDSVSNELADLVGVPKSEIIKVSAKTGEGIDKLLSAIIEKIPAPRGSAEDPLKALIFSSAFDAYKGVIAFVRLVSGSLISKNEPKLEFLAAGSKTQIKELGFFTPARINSEKISAGEVGYIATGLKDISLCKVGDTIINSLEKNRSDGIPLPGYKEPKAMVFQSIFPEEAQNFDLLEDAISKLKLSDSSLNYTKIESKALGRGLRCGFLGLFHAEIVGERLMVEYHQQVIMTIPNISYRITQKSGETLIVNDPSKIPSPDTIELIEEPFVKAVILSPVTYTGKIIDLCQKRRGILVNTIYRENTVELIYEIPLSEIIFDFFDVLKSQTQGFASLDYEFIDFRATEIVKIDICLNGEMIDPLSIAVSKEKAEYTARRSVDRLKELIPRQLYEVRIQALIGSRIIASEKVSPFRKDVIEKLYGGDRTRKDKLLEAQKKGKKKMARIGKIEIPPDTFGKFLRDF